MVNDDYSRGNSCVLGGRDEFTPFYVTVDSVIDVMGLFGNLLVVASVIKYKSLCTTTNLFVVSLAVSDLLVCLSIPYYITFYFDVPYMCDKYPCIVRYAITLYSMIVSVLTLIGVAVDRYLAVVHALTYNRLICGRWVTFSIFGIYIYVALLIFPIFWFNAWTPDIPECDLVFVMHCAYALIVVGLHVFLGLVITVFLYVQIFRVAWRQVRVVASMELNNRLHRETRTALTMVVVLCVHILSMAPFLVVIVLRYFDKQDEYALSKAKKFVMCLYFAKSAINPLIYGWKTKDFQSAFKKLLSVKNCNCKAMMKNKSRLENGATRNHCFSICRPKSSKSHTNTDEGSVETVLPHYVIDVNETNTTAV